MIEPRMLKLVEIDGQHYLKLVDVERLLHDLRRDILDHTPVDGVTENGLKKYQLTDTDREIMNYLYFVSSCIKRQLVIQCETPDEIRELHEKIRRRYYEGKYYLSEVQRDEKGKPVSILYFRKYCPGAMKARLEAEGKTEDEINEALEDSEGDPVFSEYSKDAKLFESMEQAYSNRTYLNHHCKMNLEVSDAWLLDSRMCKLFADSYLRFVRQSRKVHGNPADGENVRVRETRL